MYWTGEENPSRLKKLEGFSFARHLTEPELPAPSLDRGKGHAVNVGNENTQSLWMDSEPVAAPRYSGKLRVDVAVIGSGIAGLSVAFELIERGLSVAVIDRGKIARGMTSRTTAHLAPICDDGATEITKIRGEEMARLAWESQAAGVDRIEEIVAGHTIECHFRRLNGYLFPGPGTTQADLDEEMKAQRKCGVTVEKVHGIPGLAELKDTGVLRYSDQATFNPARYLRAIAETILGKGGKLFADTVVTEIEEADGAVTVKMLNGETLQCGACVVATNSPINDRLALHSKMAPYRTYAMAFTIPKDALPDALYWDTMDPYHYVRQETGPGTVNYLIAGGGDHKSGEADDAFARYDAIEAWTRRLFPQVGKETHRWSGQVLDTIDYSSFTGINPGNRNVYVHTGDSGQGMTHGAMAGLLIPDLITAGQSRWQACYEPSRKPLRAITNYARENMTAIKNFAEYVAPGEIASYDELDRGKGAIVREGLRKVAAYRDTNGKLHKCSAVCTHLGCHVHWNSLERCWDCPCHGSQFDIDGTALNAPAVSPLEKLD
jgi:glycine/D-amino acid oxidase-like deaminating enzyme/nitrite reductase/ring-hydroxylating ferredoxin subunit